MSEIHLISLGAGVQSSTMALMAAAGELTPMPEAAVFADTQNEPKAVYEWLDFLEKRLPFPVHRVTKGDLRAESLRPRVSKKNGLTYFKFFIPTFSLVDGKEGMLPRKCTTDFKLVPLYQKYRELAHVPRGCNEIRVISWIGISTDEATRMRPATIRKPVNGGYKTVPHPFSRNRWPLIEAGISRNDCKAWMKAQGYPEPPKSACIFCPYHSNAMWRDLKDNNPEEFAQAVQFEDELETVRLDAPVRLAGKEFLHDSRVPLDQVDFTDPNAAQLDLFQNECEGMCGV